MNFNAFNVLAMDSNEFKLLPRESLLIKHGKPILNKAMQSFPLEPFD